MSFKKDQTYSFLFIKLIILSFIFSLPSIQPIESYKHEVEKFSQIETSADVAVLKSTAETKLLKRIPFLESDLPTQKKSFSAISYSLNDFFFDYKISIISYDLQSSLARAPPVA